MLIEGFSIGSMFFCSRRLVGGHSDRPRHDWLKAIKGALDTAFDAAKPAIEEIAENRRPKRTSLASRIQPPRFI
jgi:hypothetical protein